MCHPEKVAHFFISLALNFKYYYAFTWNEENTRHNASIRFNL